MMMMEQHKKEENRQAEIQLSLYPTTLPLPLPRPPAICLVCLMSEKIYKIEIENKLTTLFVAHAGRRRGWGWGWGTA